MKYLTSASKTSSVPVRFSALTLVAIWAMVAGVAMGVTVWWVHDAASNDGGLHAGQHAGIVAPEVPFQTVADTASSASAPDTRNESPPIVARPVEVDSAVTVRRVGQQGDLLSAIKRAQAKTGSSSTLPTQADQPTWQNMSDSDAAKVFENAIRVAQQRSVIASPFDPVHH